MLLRENIGDLNAVLIRLGNARQRVGHAEGDHRPPESRQHGRRSIGARGLQIAAPLAVNLVDRGRTRLRWSSRPPGNARGSSVGPLVQGELLVKVFAPGCSRSVLSKSAQVEIDERIVLVVDVIVQTREEKVLPSQSATAARR